MSPIAPPLLAGAVFMVKVQDSIVVVPPVMWIAPPEFCVEFELKRASRQNDPPGMLMAPPLLFS